MEQHRLWVIFLFDELLYFLTGQIDDPARSIADPGAPPSDQFGAGFFNVLRQLTENGLGSTVYSGLWEIEKYLQSTSKTLPHAVFSTADAPFYLPPLDRVGCDEVWRGRSWLEFDESGAEYLVDLTGGIPPLLQAVLQKCWNAAKDHFRLRKLSRGHLELLREDKSPAEKAAGWAIKAEDFQDLATYVFSRKELSLQGDDEEALARHILCTLAKARASAAGDGYMTLAEVVARVAPVSPQQVETLLGRMRSRHWFDLPGANGEPRFRLRSKILAEAYLLNG